MSLCRMHVLTQQMLLGGQDYDELIPLWAKRMKVMFAPPPLFESINLLFLRRGVAGTTKGMDVLLWGVGRQTIFGFKSGGWQSKKNEPIRLSIWKP